MKNKKGNLALYMTWFFIAIVIITISALLAPMGVEFNTQMYKAGESILQDAQPTINNISNDEVRTSLMEATNKSLDNTEMNIDISSNVFRFGWLFLIIVSAAALFIGARQLAEISRMGGGGLV